MPRNALFMPLHVPFFFSLCLLLLAACEFDASGSSQKQDSYGENPLLREGAFALACYAITVTSMWTKEQHGVLPENVGFSENIVVAVHNNGYRAFHLYDAASSAIQLLAQEAQSYYLLNEIQSTSHIHSVGAWRSISGFEKPSQVLSFNQTVSTNADSVSLFASIAPSPDWFIAFDEPIKLFDRVKEKFVERTASDLIAYDAGTEEGKEFNNNNNPSYPVQEIIKLSASVSPFRQLSDPPLARVEFRKNNDGACL